MYDYTIDLMQQVLNPGHMCSQYVCVDVWTKKQTGDGGDDNDTKVAT